METLRRMNTMYCNIAVVLLIITVSVVVVVSCPNKCTCNTIMRGVILNCTNQGLTVIPNIPSDSYKIDLTRNQFTNIKRFTFFNIPELNFLYLNGNELENIEEKSFVLLDRLRHLYLHDNSLTTISQGLFRDLPDLYILRLQNNKISVIEPYAFTNLPDLGRVFLEYNSISLISEYSFVNVSKLYILNLELVCNCQNFPFMTWVKQVSRYDVTCSDRNHVELSNLHMCHFKDCDTQLNDMQTESTTLEVTTETTTYAVILGSVGGIVGLSVIVVVVILFMKRTSILKKFKDIPKQKGSALYENEILLDHQVYQDLTLVRRDNDSPYDAIHNFIT
ncbi:SLIT and NTRK-like protein 3 [Mytilus californianus]|uniref:SLIT and NTRK-like protein 3 n=1 Tax=Mytilus californianus TaxID=6549 RepID=UPI002247CF13|nr:SLIT and NTRK-like protein 3 [Mytilus californianus]